MYINPGQNLLNNKQISEIASNLVGISKTSNASIFSKVCSLDDNKNEQIDASELTFSKVASLGKKKLNALAEFFGISTQKATENSQAKNYEDIQQDSVVEDYFAPLLEASMDDDKADVANIKSMKRTMKAIIQEKRSQGVTIVSKGHEERIGFSDGSYIIKKDDGRITFDDGSFLSMTKDKKTGKYSLIYSRTAEDGQARNAVEISGINTDDYKSFNMATSFSEKSYEVKDEDRTIIADNRQEGGGLVWTTALPDNAGKESHGINYFAEHYTEGSYTRDIESFKFTKDFADGTAYVVNHATEHEQYISDGTIDKDKLEKE